MDCDVETILSMVQDICMQTTYPDGIEFDTDSLTGELIKGSDEYPGVRVKFLGRIEETLIHMQLDFGFGDVVVPGATEIVYPSLLDMTPPRLLAYTPESVIAEKLESIVRFELISSRVKDFYDIWLLANEIAFEGTTLQSAIVETFRHRGRELSSDVLRIIDEYSKTERAAELWTILRRKARLEEAPADLAVTAKAIREFLGPLIRAVELGLPTPGIWKPAGPWGD